MTSACALALLLLAACAPALASTLHNNIKNNAYISSAQNDFRSPAVSPGRAQMIRDLASTNAGGIKAKSTPASWFAQRLNHFDQSDERTWQQRYFLSETYFNADLGGPIFLQLGGEGAISSAYVDGALMMANYAQQNGALQVALEHRFYGESHPFPTMDTPNLRYLTSQLALADAAAFVSDLFERYPTARGLVVFGGSYPGALAAWFRLKYPHLVSAAVSSSSPVLAVEDMISYLDVVDRSLAQIGGAACDAHVRSAFLIVDAMLNTSSGRAQLDQDFNTCHPLSVDSMDQANFLSNLIGDIMGAVQYNREIPGAVTVTQICKDMSATSDSYKNLVVLSASFRSGKACTPVSFEVAVEQLQNTTAWGVNTVGMRQWTYQTCNEFGYFQTTDGHSQPFGVGLPLAFYTNICKRVFGLSVGPHIKFTNSYYGSNKPYGATRILFVNGNVDPWSSLSVTYSLTPSLTALFIDGTAHCANMFPPRPSDPPGLYVARNQTNLQIREWLAAPWQ